MSVGDVQSLLALSSLMFPFPSLPGHDKLCLCDEHCPSISDLTTLPTPLREFERRTMRVTSTQD